MSTVLRERTPHGVTLVVVPGTGPVTAEAWLGGGVGDEGDGEHGLAHLAEHVALAAAERHADLRRAGVGLDGWVTPAATVFRAVAPPGAVMPALTALAAAAGAAVAPPALVAEEQDRIDAEDAAAPWLARSVAGWWHGRDDRSRRATADDAATVESWWRASYRADRTTVAVRGADIGAVRRAMATSWARGDGGRRLRRPAAAPSRATVLRAPAAGGAGAGVAAGGAGGAADGAAVGWIAGARCDDVAPAELAALAIAAAAARLEAMWPGIVGSDLLGLRAQALWLIAGAGAAPSSAAWRDGWRRLAALDAAAVAGARAAAPLPMLGVDGDVGELAAGQHLHGDPRWSARLRAHLDAITPADVAAVVQHRLARRVRVAAPAPTRPARRRPTAAPAAAPAGVTVKRATLPDGARVVATRLPGADTVAIRVAWRGGFADEDPAHRGVVGLLAATAPLACAARDTVADTAALGGELAGVAGRWSAGLRSRWPAAAWRDGLAVVADCALRPALARTTVVRERARLAALAAGVAGSPARIAFRAYLAARWGRHVLARDPLATATELAALDRAAVARWSQQHQAPAGAVIVIAGDVDPDEAIAEVRARFAARRGAEPAVTGAPAPSLAEAAPPPPLPEIRQVFVDGPEGTTAIVIGLPGLAADHVDRPLLDGLAAALADPRGRLRAATAAAGMFALRVALVDGPDTGYLAIELEGAPPGEAAIAATAAVLRALADSGPTLDELAAARAAMAPDFEPGARADALARAELAGTAPPAPAPLAAATLQRVAAEVLRWDEAVIATVRPPDITPGARKRAGKRVSPRRRGRR